MGRRGPATRAKSRPRFQCDDLLTFCFICSVAGDRRPSLCVRQPARRSATGSGSSSHYNEAFDLRYWVAFLVLWWLKIVMQIDLRFNVARHRHRGCDRYSYDARRRQWRAGGRASHCGEGIVIDSLFTKNMHNEFIIGHRAYRVDSPLAWGMYLFNGT